MVQTSCRTRKEQRQHESRAKEVALEDTLLFILTLDIQVRASGRWTAPCSTHCRATSPWSVSSCNLRFYTGGSFHALNIKEKQRPMSSLFSLYTVVYTQNTLITKLMTPLTKRPGIDLTAVWPSLNILFLNFKTFQHISMSWEQLNILHNTWDLYLLCIMLVISNFCRRIDLVN